MQFQLRLVHQPKIFRVFKQFQQPIGPRLAHLDTVKQQTDFALERFGIAGWRAVCRTQFSHQLFGFREKTAAQPFLGVNEGFNSRFKFPVLVIVRHHRRPADDQRNSCFINEDRVHFVHDGVVMAALHLLLFARGHPVVAQVIETELRVRAVGDVAAVLLAPDGRRLVVQNASHAQPCHLVNRAHPLAVARGEVIVHRDHVYAPTAQRVQIDRQRRHERLAFARGHFRDSAAVKGVTSDELDIKGNHLPLQRMPAHGDFLPPKAAAGVFHDRERFGQDFVQRRGQFGVVFDFGKALFPGRCLFAQRLVRQ